MTNPFKFALVLGGGNALGSYQAGVYQALHEQDYEPDWIAGTSAGAINGALIGGNAREQRMERLHEFWRPAQSAEAPGWWFPPMEIMRRTGAALMTLGAGRPGVFGPIGPLGSWWDPDPLAASPSLFDSRPLAAMLTRLVDFDRLNDGALRYTAGSVDLETGDDMFFDTTRHVITAEHVRASAALMPTFPPVEIEGRAYVDGGLSANLPLDPVLAAPPQGDVLCVAVDLLPLTQRPPQTLGEAIGRAQDLMFAAQSRRTIERFRALYASDDRLKASSVTLIRLAYSDQEREVAGKAMDFSPESVRYRWDSGYRDARAMLDRLASKDIAIGRSGLTIVGM